MENTEQPNMLGTPKSISPADAKVIAEQIVCLRINPDSMQAVFNLAKAYLRARDYVHAFSQLETYAAQCFGKKQYTTCEFIYRFLYKLDHAKIDSNLRLGTTLVHQKRAEEGSYYLARALYIYGSLFTEIRDFLTEVETKLPVSFITRVLDCPIPQTKEMKYRDMSQAITSFGKSLSDLHFYDAAALCYDKAIEINNESALSHWNRGLMRLSRKDFEGGWQDYEWRWKWNDFPEERRAVQTRLWDGKASLDRRTIYLQSEQGLGDSVMFSRWARVLKNKYDCNIVLETQDPMVTLFKASFPDMQIVKRPKTTNYNYSNRNLNYYFPLFSLPTVMAEKFPSMPEAYIAPRKDSVEEWKNRIHNIHGKKVGICWSSSKSPFLRKINIEELRPLLNLDINLFSLQVGVDAADLPASSLAEYVIDYSSKFTDFNQTAALIQNLDYVVTVDTAVAHVSAAMGKPTLLLLDYYPDWRWGYGKTTIPWYKTLKQIKQTTPGDWSDPVLELYTILK